MAAYRDGSSPTVQRVNAMQQAMSVPRLSTPRGRRLYPPIPPHARDEAAPFDQGIFRQPVAPGTQGLGFDNNGYTEDEWFRYVYPALVGRGRLDI